MITTEKELDEIDKKIIILIGEGKTLKEIAWKVGKKVDNVNYRIRQMKRYYNCLNLPQLIAKLYPMTT